MIKVNNRVKQLVRSREPYYVEFIKCYGCGRGLGTGQWKAVETDSGLMGVCKRQACPAS